MKTRKRVVSFLMIAMMMGLATASAAPLQIQYKESASSLDQAGRTRIVGQPPLGDTISGGDFDGLTHTADAIRTRSGAEGNTLFALVDHTDGDLDNLLSGGLQTTHKNIIGDNITLTLSGLDAGTYDITTYHHSCYLEQSTATLFDVSVDTGSGDTLIVADAEASFGDSVTTAELASPKFSFTASGSDDVVITFKPEDSFFSGTKEFFYLNGFELEKSIVATPGTLIYGK